MSSTMPGMGTIKTQQAVEQLLLIQMQHMHSMRNR